MTKERITIVAVEETALLSPAVIVKVQLVERIEEERKINSIIIILYIGQLEGWSGERVGQGALKKFWGKKGLSRSWERAAIC